VRAKSGLNKAIFDQGWFEFRRPLEYQLNWNGGMLIKVPARRTRVRQRTDTARVMLGQCTHCARFEPVLGAPCERAAA
jgi:transposase